MCLKMRIHLVQNVSSAKIGKPWNRGRKDKNWCTLTSLCAGGITAVVVVLGPLRGRRGIRVASKYFIIDKIYMETEFSGDKRERGRK